MLPEKMEQGFNQNLEAIQLLQNALGTSFLEAYVENAENLIDDYQVRVVDGVPTKETTQRITALYEELKKLSFEPEEWRRLSQLLLLKGSQTEHLQANHQLTPDSIGFLFVFLIEQLYTNKKAPVKILDIAAGMGNLLLTVLLNLSNAGYQTEGIGVDIDDTLLAVAASTSDLTQANVQYFHQDGLQELLIDPVDFAISDLPIGYYPNDEKAKEFLTSTEEGHSYAHHLLLEQSMKYVKPDGFGLFLMPSGFLETDQSEEIKKWFKEEGYLQGMIQLYQMPEETVVAKGIVERIGLQDSIFTIKYGDNQKFEQIMDIENHEVAVKMLLDQLIELQILSSYDEITGVGHRVVHGGETYGDSVVIDEKVMDRIAELAEFAPLHNPANLMGIKAFKKILPDILSVAVFDTSFHSTMPKQNYLYSLPVSYYEDFKVRKYGFHGTSHRYVSERAAKLLNKPIEELKIITCHLGNGVSITAVDGGKSMDTSMGFTPLAGVTMGTRSGDIDPAVLPYLMEKLEIDIDEMINVLNKKSGLLGLTGLSSDMRDLEKNYEKEHIRLAYDIFVDRIRKYIGGYVTTMNGVDAIVFTAGIGENDGHVRSEIIKGMSWFGCEIDPALNELRGEEVDISTKESKVRVLVIPTDEELMIARDVERLRG